MTIKIIEKGFGFHVQAVKPVNPVWWTVDCGSADRQL